MTDRAPPPDRCPLCGEANQCGMAAGEETCWCFDRVIPPQVLDRIPERARNVACVCPRCASGAEPVVEPPSGE